MIRQERVQFGVMRSVRARDIERGLHLTSSIREPSIERDVKDVIEIEIDCIQSGQIGESIKRPVERLFLLPNENYYVVNERFAKDAARPPDEEIGILDVFDIGRQFHDYRSLGVKAASMIQLEHRVISQRLRVLRTSRPSMARDRAWGR
jgi:hypothetical protein